MKKGKKEEMKKERVRKGGWFHSTFSPFSFINKEKKKEKNGTVHRLFYAVFSFFLQKLGRRGAEKGVHFTAVFVHEKMEKR